MNIFTNKAISIGIKNYNCKINGLKMSKANIFEYYVIQMLVFIYGEINILNPFKLNSVKGFKKNLQIYGFSAKKVEDFINLLEEYENWLQLSNQPKNNIYFNIQSLLLEMVLLKSVYKKIEKDEFNYYNDFFTNNLPGMSKILDMISLDKNCVIKLWDIKKVYLNKDFLRLDFVKLQPKLLTETNYSEYGISLKDIAKLSNDTIEKINNKIIVDAEETLKKKRKFKIPLKVALTSGSGFVDTLVLLSVMATEIMIGFLIALMLSR